MKLATIIPPPGRGTKATQHPVVTVGSHGVTVVTGSSSDSPAHEWVPFNSKAGYTAVILESAEQPI